MFLWKNFLDEINLLLQSGGRSPGSPLGSVDICVLGVIARWGWEAQFSAWSLPRGSLFPSGDENLRSSFDFL